MGAEKDIIVAVELGSASIRAIAGRRESDGTMQVLAIAQEKAENAIRKGIVDNIEKTTQAISHVVGTLNDKLGIYTTRIYVGLSGQSLHTRQNLVPYRMPEKTQITNNHVDQLKEINNGVMYAECKIMDVIPQEYRIATRKVFDPVGMVSDAIEAHFVNVVARCSLAENIEKCVRNAGYELADQLISPLCKADAMLSSNEKRYGCALVDMGADTTTVCVYTNNILRHLAVIPLGGANVTADIAASKGLDNEEAERLKLKYGNIFHEEPADKKPQTIELTFERSMSESELLDIIEARYEEILANVWKQLSPYGVSLNSGIVITGGASRVRNIVQAFSNITKFDKQIRVAKGLPQNVTLASGLHISENDDMSTLIGLLLKGDQPCVGEAPKDEIIPEDTIEEIENAATETEEKPEEPETGTQETDQEEEAKEDKKEKKSGDSMSKKFSRLWGIIKDMVEEKDE